MIAKIKEFLTYPSTWAGLVTGLTLLGVNVSPEQSALIQQAGIGLVALIFTFFSDSDVKGK